MATGGEIEDEANTLINMLEKCSIGTGEEERCTPQCWTVSEIEVWNKKRSILLPVKNVFPAILQFLVQRQQKVICKIAEKYGFDIHLDRSKNRLEAETVGDQEEEALDKMIEKFIQQIEAVCDMYSVKAFVIEDNVWPCVEREFNEKAKDAFKESFLQVYKKCEGTYCLIGFAETFEKYASLLLYISSQYKAIRIENKELFDALELEKILDSGFKQVKVAVHGDLLLLQGEEEVIKECAKHYEELSKTENMHFAIRVVSKNMYEFLKRKRSKISSCLFAKGYRVYWTVKKGGEKYFLTCSSISGKPEKEIDFLTNCIVKEIELDENYLQGEQVSSKIEQMENAKLSTSESGIKTLVYYGNIDFLEKAEAKGTQQRFWFDQTIASSGLLRFLNRLEVQNFINSKLPNHATKWSIIEDKRKLRVSCQCLAEVDHLVSLILDQVWCVSRPAEVCPDDQVKQFWKDHSNFVEIEQDEKYCTFYVTVDLKDELGRLLGVHALSEIDEDENDSEICSEIPTERMNVFIEPDIRIYLFKRCKAQLTKISEDFNVCISYKGTSLELKGKSKEKVLHAKQDLLELLNSIVYQKDIVRIKREWDIDILKKEIDKLAEKNSCTFMLSKKDEELEYLKCWDAQNVHIVAAEGSLEDTMCDVLVCFLDQNLQPVERSSKKIFMTGGWTEIEDTVKNSKEIQRKNWLPNSSKCKLYSSGETGFLKCRQLLFVSSANLLKDIEEVWNKVLEDADENQWRSICFPVELSLITDGFLARFLSILAKGVSKRLQNSLEIQFCAWDTNESLRGRILDIFHQCLSSEYIPIHCLEDEKERKQDTKKSLHSTIEVKLEQGTLLEVAEAKKVNVIVNSTNPELNLKKGFVSSIILERGGQEMEDELSHEYKKGIEYGSIAVSSGQRLGFQKIFHCALYNRWVSTGNFSLKVLKCLITRCLLKMEEDGLHTIAFPVLGTGKLGYPYIPVAKTMMECVTDFGKQHPETCIQTVYVVVHEADKHCAQVFEDVFEDGFVDRFEDPDNTSQLNIGDILSKPTISFLEYRMLDRGILLQVLPEDIDEPMDAVIKFSSKDNTSGAVDLEWCREKACYSALMSVSMEHLQNIVDQCFRMLDSKRITSARIHITDSMKDSELYTKVIKAFMRKLKQIIDKRYANGISLRKLQFLLCKEQYEKMESSYTSDPNVFYGIFQSAIGKDSRHTWRKKTVKRQRDVLVSVCGSSSDHVERALSEFRESAAYATGNWCVLRDFKWAFVSSITNVKLNKAMEQGLKNIEIKEEDGTYNYDLKNKKRNPSQEQGDIKPEEIRCLPDHNEENKPMPTWTMLWYVQQENKWMLLPEDTCRMLTDALRVGKVSDKQHVYNLKIFKRTPKGKNGKSEEIMFIKAREDDKASGGTNTSKEMHEASRKGFNQTDEEQEEDLKIFEFLTGQITYPNMGKETQKNEIKKKLESLGCKVTFMKDCTFCIEGSFSQITRVNELEMTPEKENGFLDASNLANIVYIPMSRRDYKAFCFFGNKCKWFKKYGNQLQFDGQGLSCDIPRDEEESIKREMETHLKEVKMMCTVQTEIDRKKGYNLTSIIQNMHKEYPNVCLVENEKDIEMISESYGDLVKVQALLNHQMVGKTNKRVGRTFEKTDNPEQHEESQSSNDVYRRQGSTENRYYNTTQRLKELVVKTKEGLKIRIYTGSIVRLNVDCIVNAANDQLMHGGGVAAAISDAAGYKFGQESRDYVQKHGRIQVGTCCVTSAGDLPCKLVIHTVGPRWDDYRDKNRCLQLLYDSVEVTFIEADKRGMSSIAIPAISSGIFAVPRDLCVQQYYKAVMSFSRDFAFKSSLQEIHFVDKDESMVRAIQEVFQLKEPPASNTEKSGNLDQKNETPAYGAENSVSSTMPLSNYFTIVDFSENLQIKIHIGNITDIAADAIVCPQDEYCRSEDVIARNIFRDIPDEKPISKQMKLGNSFPQRLQGNSQWKMIIHAFSPGFDKEHAKDTRQFGKILDSMIQIIMKTADESKIESIVIPLLGTGIGEYNTPVQICSSSFFKAVTAYKSEVMHLKDIYLVLKDKEDEEMYVERFKYTCKITNRTLMDSENSGSLANTVKGMPEEENCCICMDTPTNPKKLPKCGHTFCKECIEQSFKYKPACPNCGTIYGKVTGDQPPGFISIRKSSIRLQGFNDSSGSIVLTYTFDDGKQGAEHPDPGKVYKGISRSGYLPNNKKGRLIAKLLNVAFSRRLVFTIGRSRTTGHDGVITWNDIHHKTRIDGGPARFGYPDPTYLDRVLEELEAKGVTEVSADDPEEYQEYSRQIRY